MAPPGDLACNPGLCPEQESNQQPLRALVEDILKLQNIQEARHKNKKNDANPGECKPPQAAD